MFHESVSSSLQLASRLMLFTRNCRKSPGSESEWNRHRNAWSVSSQPKKSVSPGYSSLMLP